MPTFPPELLRYLEAIAAPFRRLAESDSSFALGRRDKEFAGMPDTLANIAAKYSVPGRPLKATSNGDSGELYYLSAPGLKNEALGGVDKFQRRLSSGEAPRMDVTRNYAYEPLVEDNWDTSQLLPPKYDIDANYASGTGLNGRGLAMQMYPAAWDLIRANNGTDMSRQFKPDNFMRKTAALQSALLKGKSMSHVPFSGEMFLGMDTDKYPAAKLLANLLSGQDVRKDPRAYNLAPNGQENVINNSALLSPDQRVGGLALTEAAKVNQRIGGMRQVVQEQWHNAQWPLEGPGTFTNNFQPDAETLRYLGAEHKIGTPTIKRSLMADWASRMAEAGASSEDIQSMMGDQAQHFGQGSLYAEGGVVKDYDGLLNGGAPMKKYAGGGQIKQVGKVLGEALQGLKATFPEIGGVAAGHDLVPLSTSAPSILAPEQELAAALKPVPKIDPNAPESPSRRGFLGKVLGTAARVAMPSDLNPVKALLNTPAAPTPSPLVQAAEAAPEQGFSGYAALLKKAYDRVRANDLQDLVEERYDAPSVYEFDNLSNDLKHAVLEPHEIKVLDKSNGLNNELLNDITWLHEHQQILDDLSTGSAKNAFRGLPGFDYEPKGRWAHNIKSFDDYLTKYFLGAQEFQEVGKPHDDIRQQLLRHISILDSHMDPDFGGSTALETLKTAVLKAFGYAAEENLGKVPKWAEEEMANHPDFQGFAAGGVVGKKNLSDTAGGLAQCACDHANGYCNGGHVAEYAEGGLVDKVKQLLDTLEWHRAARQPGFLFGEGYMRDVNGDVRNIEPYSELRPMVASTKEPVVPIRQTNPLMGYHTIGGKFDGSGVPIYFNQEMSRDRLPHLDESFWPGTAKIPKMAEGGRPGYQPVRSTYGTVHTSSGEPAWSKDFHYSEQVPPNPDLHQIGQALGHTEDPIIQRLQHLAMPQGMPLDGLEVRPLLQPEQFQGEPLDDGPDVQPYTEGSGHQGFDFAPDLLDALRALEQMKQ